ncbi:DEAD/DEAH box helicase [Microvirga sp. VF16]|uniref:DEAD/DEAH box helicase n=1 Tax=Microvirga sp. VF16 TaxID=2807101 RepID=UPI00193DB283|nr:DEAD/DEAH box helicase [Microvirga sp. VF16]QRM36033.1 DEAD/DEAH box helicase [Microvirga sp. VF16]
MTRGSLVAGARIRVRNAEWVVGHVDPSPLSGNVIHAIGLSGVVRDKAAIFVETVEKARGRGIEVVDPANVTLVADESSGYTDTLLHLEAALRKSAPTGEAIQVAGKAAIDDLDFQLDPVRMALKAPRARILIGDDVGLGKTLEAGLLTSELILRRRAKRILVVATKAMLAQFQHEFWTRFSVPLVRIDSDKIRQIRTRIPLNHNPFDQFDKAIISVDTLKNDLQYRTALEKAWWDLIIIDEAHNVAERRGAGGVSQRNQLAERLASRSDALILMSATPHDGSRRSFASLMRMLDPTSIANPDSYKPDDIQGLFVRRFRTTPAVSAALKSKVQKRATQRLDDFSPSPAEEAAYEILANLDLQEDKVARNRGQRLFKTLLEKALFSSPAACAETLEKRIKTLLKDGSPEAQADVAALGLLLEAVQAIGADDFAKYQRLRKLLTDIKWSPRKKDDRIVVFSERIATLEWLAKHLREHLGLNEEQVKTLHASGGDADRNTQEVVRDFGLERSPIRILLASDMASEGLNLHYLSHKLIHFDIPWALLTFQQRNGRIDRYGQERKPHIWYLIAQSAQPKIRGDLRVLDRLIEKDEAAQDSIRDPSAFLGTNDEQEQEDVVADAIEQGVSAEQFDAEMNARADASDAAGDDAYAALEAFFEMAQPEPPAVPTEREAGRPSVFETTFDFTTAALERVKAWKHDLQFEVDRTDRVITLPIPDDFRERSDFGGRAARAVDARFMPPEAEPQDGRVRLTDNRSLMNDRIVASRQGAGGGWPEFQYLWDVHPAVDWLADKISGVFGRQNAPVARLVGLLKPNQTAFVFNGVVPNLKGQPLVDEWPVVLFSGSEFTGVETAREFLARTRLGRTEIPNIGTTRLDDVQKLVEEAVGRAQTYVHQARKRFQNELDGELLALDERLEALRARHRQTITDLFGRLEDNAIQRSKKARQEEKVEQIFASWWDWIKKTRETPNDPNPYVRLVAVFRG